MTGDTNKPLFTGCFPRFHRRNSAGEHERTRMIAHVVLDQVPSQCLHRCEASGAAREPTRVAQGEAVKQPEEVFLLAARTAQSPLHLRLEIAF